MSFKIKLSKSADQQTITIRQTDSTDISGLSSVTANVYTADVSTAVNTYAFTAGDLTNLKAGSVDIDTTDLLGGTDDNWYRIVLDGDTIDSDAAGVGITLEAQSKVYSKQGAVDVYSAEYRIPNVLHGVHMIVSEMNAIEHLDPALQKRVDFTTRWALLKEILGYE